VNVAGGIAQFFSQSGTFIVQEVTQDHLGSFSDK
jgi:hypothetical protein